MRLALVGGPPPITASPEGDLAFEAGALEDEVVVGVSTLDDLITFGFDGGGVGSGSPGTGPGLLGPTDFGASVDFGVSRTGFGGGGILEYSLVTCTVDMRSAWLGAGEGGCEVCASYARGVALYGLGETYVSDGSLRRFVMDAEARAWLGTGVLMFVRGGGEL